ncbi:MAG: 16S rRNA (cytosine(1402)-N(4))-methyltransferase RsmH [Candidatus Omnitrophica bacterium]|nr:16S rRNA (cytosine(1402)-N(4))-methyltransferase RsmH [Candidatus Omnitrophota bacterium]
MVREVEGVLNLKAADVFVDCTLGLGGHSWELGSKLGHSGRLVGIDQDDAAITKAKERLAKLACRVDIVKSNFHKLDQVLDSLGIAQVDAFLFDLGVSSLQLDEAERGFSFRKEGPLDMRMDVAAPLTALELVHSLSEEELSSLIWKYGEDRFSRRIAKAIVRARASRPLETTKDLADIILHSIPNSYQRDKIHPATRTFQALRMAVNSELDVLSVALDKAFLKLKTHGRMAVIAFHSLEDRIVKEKFRLLAHEGRAEILTKKPLRPSEEESSDNPRSRSARLRALERIA